MAIEPIYKDIGAIIRAKRRALDWPQEQLAARLSISRATLANIETGRQRVLAHQLYEFADALGMKAADLLPAPPSVTDWADLNFSADLKPEQRQQIAQLIGQVQTAPAKPKEEPDGQPTNRVARQRRKGTA